MKLPKTHYSKLVKCKLIDKFISKNKEYELDREKAILKMLEILVEKKATELSAHHSYQELVKNILIEEFNEKEYTSSVLSEMSKFITTSIKMKKKFLTNSNVA